MDDEDDPRRPLLRVVQESFLPKSISIALKCILVGINIASITVELDILFFLHFIGLWRCLSVLQDGIGIELLYGVFYFNSCPGQYLIPYYLIISGAASLLHLSLTCLPCAEQDQATSITFANFCAQGVILLFLFIFFIAGNVWVYSLAGASWDDPLSPRFCARVLYLFAFWTLTLIYIGLFLLLGSYLCLLLSLYILKWSIFGIRRQ